MGCNCPGIGSNWELLVSTEATETFIPMGDGSANRFSSMCEQMKDSNCHDMTWRANQHSGNSHVHFVVTPLTFLLCGSDPKEWSLALRREALKSVQRHNTGLKQTAVWNLKAGQKISQQTPIVKCVRIISIFSVNTTCFYPYSISDSWRHFVDPPLFVVLPHLSTFSHK